MKNALTALCFFAVLVLSGCVAEDEPTLQASILKIGKADTSIFMYGDQTVIIDAGEEDDGEEIVQFLDNKGIDKIDYFIITHFDKDHVGGADYVLQEKQISELLLPDYKGTHKEYDEFIEQLKKTSIKPTVLNEDYEFALGEVQFLVNPPAKSSYKGDNDYSLVTSIHYGDISMLFAGDAEEIRLQELLDQNLGTSTLLKVPHHGRFNDNSESFFNMVSPKYAVITSSDKNKEQKEVVNALAGIGAQTYVTRNGDITIITDGKEFNIEQ